MSEGSRRRLSFVTEVTPGTTPATPSMKRLRNTGGGGIQIDRTSLKSAEFRDDRRIPSMRLGNRAAKLDVPIEFSYGSFDDFLESAFFGAWAANVLNQGVTKKFFSIEEAQLDLVPPSYQVLRGAIVNTLELSIQPDAMVTGSLGLLGLTGSTFGATALDADVEEVMDPITDPFDSFTGSLMEGGVTLAQVTGLNLKVDNGLQAFYALFNKDVYKIGVGRADFSGSISLFFESVAMLNKFINETESSLTFELIDLLNNKYTFLLPRIKYTGMTKTPSENNFVIDMPFQALFDTVTGTTARITRTPHA